MDSIDPPDPSRGPAPPADPLDALSGLNPSNRAWVEELYAQWVESPGSVPRYWAERFEGLGDGRMQTREDILGPPPRVRTLFGGREHLEEVARAEHIRKNAAVLQLISGYRRTGHLIADLDPLGLRNRPRPRELTLEYWGLTKRDLGTVFDTGRLAGPSHATLEDILARCEETYCRTLGSEFMYIRDEERRRWVERRVEEARGRVQLDRPTALRVLEKLTSADQFESFIHTKYLGAKRFSIEGAESLIPLLDLMLSNLGNNGAKEIVIGMAHRGRLNVLANILGKASQDIFEEFEDAFAPPSHLGSGDVKYHLGYASDITTAGGHGLHVRVAFNPSHLEFVNPVVEGMVRAKQDHFGDITRRRTVPILIHGDAAVIGQGVVPETLNLSRIPGYRTGGTIHVVVNNQIGFTTPPRASRSSEYPTDVAKLLLPPVFHVNGDDLGAVAFVARMAADYRETFGQDVFIDLWSYRKYGHNEGDEPAFTNPAMYQAIRGRKSPLQRFVEQAKADGVITDDDVQAAAKRVKGQLENALAAARTQDRPAGELAGLWKGLHVAHAPAATDMPTRVDEATLAEVAEALSVAPEGFEVHRKMQRILEYRAAVGRGEEPADWSMGEALAFGTLLREGTPIRITGQDTGRGTFSHRHAVLHHQRTGEPYVPLGHLPGVSARFDVLDSPLSETGVLGFEFGYSLSTPEALVVWEAQFGDFANGAQVIIDQFIASSADKWNRYSGLVLLLPHGYEGQGPEHSSARLERFLQLSGEDNWVVANLTTPAQLFHALRRQIHRNYRRPLVVMTPKSLLRHPKAVSPLSDLAAGGFKPVIPDGRIDPRKVDRVVLCSGKVYFDLLAARETAEDDRTALIRVEQLYPLPDEILAMALGQYPAADGVVWCQEEPENMGAWSYIAPILHRVAGKPVRYAGRARSASPATGSKSLHDEEQRALIRSALAR